MKKPGYWLMAWLAAGSLNAGSVEVETHAFGKTESGEEVSEYVLRSGNGLTARILTYGAILHALEVPDGPGRGVNVSANCATLSDYASRSPGFGATIGRYANRIAGAKFTLDGVEHAVTRNAGKHHIHGGHRGFAKVVWQVAGVERKEGAARLTLVYVSRDGEEGFPGELTCRLTYELNERDELRMEYEATTTKPTHINVCNHAYWNLAGAYAGDVLGHELTVNAEEYLLVDGDLIPTGEVAKVTGTPVDFRQARRIGERIGEIRERQFGGGYDHCLVLKKERAGELSFCARLADPGSGRVMEVWTTEPGVQLYSANFGAGSFKGPNGYAYPRHLGFCLETQHYPDSPNRPSFPTTVLRPGETFRSTTVHRFTWRR